MIVTRTTLKNKLPIGVNCELNQYKNISPSHTLSYNLIYYRASSRMHSLVNSLYFHWLFTILLCADWLTVNQKNYLSSALHNPSYQVRLFLFPRLESQIYFCGSHFKFPSEFLYIRLATQIL